MSDLVEELRKVGELQGDTYSSYEILALLKQARVEIERLQMVLRMAWPHVVSEGDDMLATMICETLWPK